MVNLPVLQQCYIPFLHMSRSLVTIGVLDEFPHTRSDGWHCWVVSRLMGLSRTRWLYLNFCGCVVAKLATTRKVVGSGYLASASLARTISHTQGSSSFRRPHVRPTDDFASDRLKPSLKEPRYLRDDLIIHELLGRSQLPSQA
jgi:hypothetical protein